MSTVEGFRCPTTAPICWLRSGPFRTAGVSADKPKYGAAYATNLKTMLDFDVDESATEVTITTDS